MRIELPARIVTPAAPVGVVRVIVTGSRDHADCDMVIRGLVRVRYAHPGARLVVMQGECPTGADRCARHFVTQARARFGWDVVAEPYPADWDSCGDDCPPRPHRVRRRPGDTMHPGVLADYCPGAGPRRNAHMVAAGADVVHAYPSRRSRGTRNCMRLAGAAGILVVEFAGART
ncbi:SLOG family protein [Embleya sp. NPDC005971]|uniref:SLOG family protein n=1 Tax=Embleya sp. NPDC005971 TaxID=3156724 RepID=UPI0033EC8210